MKPGWRRVFTQLTEHHPELYADSRISAGEEHDAIVK